MRRSPRPAAGRDPPSPIPLPVAGTAHGVPAAEVGMAAAPGIVPATLDWRDGLPRSAAFGDVYYTSADGRDEVRQVFMAGNELPARWQGQDFAIGETGFGTGLNFLVAAETWLAQVPEPAVLHYLSVEKHPLRRADLELVLAARGDTSPLAGELLDAYPPPLPGCHRLALAGGRIQLSLLWGDAEAQLEAARCAAQDGFETQAARGIDAWFLDGFAPARNPEMWSAGLFVQLAAHSRPGTTFATFTAAGAVRRGLAAAGFEVRRVPGYGAKREMLRGRFAAPPAAPASPAAAQRLRRPGTPWDLGAGFHAEGARSAAVVGAGLAGCTIARALAGRGWRVRVFDGRGIAGGASGNPQGIVYPRLAAADSAFTRINLAALLYARNYYRPFWRAGIGADSGVLMLPRDSGEAGRLRQLAAHYPGELATLLEGPDLVRTAGVPLAAGCGLLLRGLGWLPPAELCRRLLDHPRIRFDALDIRAWSGTAGGWRLDAPAQPVDEVFPVLVLAAAAGLRHWAASAHLPLRTIQGQITSCPATPASRGLRLPVCGLGYLAPAVDGRHTLGATYRPDSVSLAVDALSHGDNLARVRATDPALAEALGDPDPAQLEGRAGLRCVTPDYLPIAGPAPRLDEFLEVMAPLRRDARAALPRTGACWPGLYLHAGHGSRGLAYAPLCAALLADLIEGRPRPLPRDLVQALSPARFLVRDLQRRRR